MVEIIADNVFFGDSKNEQREAVPASEAATAPGFEPDFSATAAGGPADFEEIIDDSDFDSFPPFPG